MEEIEKNYSREELINICEKAFIKEEDWEDRDSASAQCQLGECYALMKAGCEFKVDYEDELCKTNEREIWLYVYSKGFEYFDYSGIKEKHHYYLPTLETLENANGKDWYKV